MPSFLSSISPEVFDAIGLCGFGLYVMNYTLLTLDKLQSQHLSYFLINWLAATLVLIGLMAAFNLAAALIQIFWIGISTVGIVLRLRRRRAPVDARLRKTPIPFATKRTA